MALAVQPQWDIGSSAFAASDKIRALIQAVTVDDVQLTAIYAAEALGGNLDVDPRLTGKAVDALGGDQSYRLSKLKLCLGLSQGGVASQLRGSHRTIKTFLLVTALVLHLEDWEIGNVLYELLIQAGAIDQTPVSTKQLTDLVASIQGHARLLAKTESLVRRFQVPVIERIAAVEENTLGVYYEQPPPNKIAHALLACFEALRDDDVYMVIIFAGHSVIHFISIILWLCPTSVEVVHSTGQTLFPCPCDKAKIRVCVDSKEKDWRFERCFRLSHPRSLFETVGVDKAYLQTTYPSSVPLGMAYWLIRSSLSGWSPQDFTALGSVAHGLVLAAFHHGFLYRTTGLHPKSPSQSIAFRDIFSSEGESFLRNSLQLLGFPPEQTNTKYGQAIAGFFPIEHGALDDRKRKGLIQDLDLKCMEGSAQTSEHSDFRNIKLMNTAMGLAETILLRATQHYPTEMPFYYSRIEEILVEAQFPIILPLLDSDPSVMLRAVYFLRMSLTSLSAKARELASNNQHQLALCCGGQVAYFGGLLRTPRTSAEAFEIIVQPGRIMWRDVPQDFLCDTVPGTVYGPVAASDSDQNPAGSAPRPILYEFLSDGEPVPSLPSLRNSENLLEGFSISMTPGGLRLRFVQESMGGASTTFILALVNFALAKRVRASEKPLQAQILECVEEGVGNLTLIQPKSGSIMSEVQNQMCVATYGGHELADFLRFGSPVADNVPCVIQGPASISDCALAARQAYGSVFLIMATPIMPTP